MLSSNIKKTKENFSRIDKVIDECITNFNNKYLQVSSVINEMRNDFLNKMSSLIDFISKEKRAPSSKSNNSLSSSTSIVSKLNANHTYHRSRVNKSKIKNPTPYKGLFVTNVITNGAERSKISEEAKYRANKRKCLSFHVSNKTNNSKQSQTFLSQRREINVICSPNGGKQKKSKNKITCISNSMQYKGQLKKCKTANLVNILPVHTAPNSINDNNSINNNNANKKMIFNPTILHFEKNNKGKKISALITAANSTLVPFEEKIKIKFINKEIYNKINMQSIISDSKMIILKRLGELESLVKCYPGCNESKKFPSTTAQSGLIFLTEEKQSKIINSERDEDKGIIEIIFSLLNETEIFDKEKKPCELYKMLFDKYKVNNIKSLFFDVVYKTIYKSRNIINKKEMAKIFLGYSNLIEKIKHDNNDSLFWIALNISEINEYLEKITYSKSKYKEIEDLKKYNNKIDSLSSVNNKNH